MVLLLYVIDIYCKYALVVLLKDKKCVTITNAFQNVLNSSGWKLLLLRDLLEP